MKKHVNRSGRKNFKHRGSISAVELMEPRRLLSAAVEDGVLAIEGTRRSDTIVLTMDSPKTLRVRVGNVESTFLKKSFSKIRIIAGQGDDLVTIGSDATPISLPASVSGGDGADTIIGGAGNDSLSGGNGADQITGAGGDDSVDGDNGNDDLHGGDGRDALTGGRGDDELHDDAGRDSVFGNAGTDLIYFHDDVQQFHDQAKAEHSFAEPIFQLSKSANTELLINTCPLYANDGKQFSGGLVKAGGSTLVMSGNVLRQWAGEGLASTNATVPHFDLTGGNYAGAGSGAITFNSGSYGSVITISSLPPMRLPDGVNFTVPSGSSFTSSDSTTQTIASGQTLTLAGPAMITTPSGKKYSAAEGITVTVTGAANEDSNENAPVSSVVFD